jgi:outer membrane protein
MMRVAKNFGILLFISFISINSFGSDDDDLVKNDYDANYYEDEGHMVFKVRANGIKTEAKQKGLPSPTAANPVSIGGFVQNGYGVDAATSIFFSSNIAAEVSVGFDVLRTKNTNLANIANNYGGNPSNVGKRRDLYMIPLTVTGQYHIAPFGALRPYVGAGYAGAYFFSKNKGFKVKNTHGAVLQAGIDFYAKDDTLINLDIRQYFFRNNVTYKSRLVNNQSVSSKVKLNPLMVSVGVGFKF